MELVNRICRISEIWSGPNCPYQTLSGKFYSIQASACYFKDLTASSGHIPYFCVNILRSQGPLIRVLSMFEGFWPAFIPKYTIFLILLPPRSVDTARATSYCDAWHIGSSVWGPNYRIVAATQTETVNVPQDSDFCAKRFGLNNQSLFRYSNLCSHSSAFHILFPSACRKAKCQIPSGYAPLGVPAIRKINGKWASKYSVGDVTSFSDYKADNFWRAYNKLRN